MDYVFAPTIVLVGFSIESAFNAYETLSLLSSTETLSGLNEWIYETAARLPEHVRKETMLLSMAGDWNLMRQVEDPQATRDFPSYLQWLEAYDASALRDMTASWLWDIPGDKTPPEPQALYDDVEVMMAQVAKMAAHKQSSKDYKMDVESYYAIHPLLKNPEELKVRLVEHLHWMWENVLREEWERKLPLLRASVEAYQQMDFHNLTAVEAVRAVTGRDMSSISWEWPESELIFVPSPHIGPYLGRYDSSDGSVARVMFGVRQPPNTRRQSPDLSRSELTPRINALADDTRLRILETVAQHDEICAQDIISLLDLTQSAASRNLRQLVATGYLVERRRETAKYYSINRERVDDTMRALRRLLRGKGTSV